MSINNWDHNIPNVNNWKPKENKEQIIEDAFLNRCKFIEKMIINKVQTEKKFNFNNFDSGLAVEDIIREEFEHFLPKRYTVTCGVVNDRDNKTAGDCDLVLFNSFWSPTIKPGATKSSRRQHLPIESIYSVIEIKQTLTFESLDKALEKLVKVRRLNRPKLHHNLTENRIGSRYFKSIVTNRLFTGIIGVLVSESISSEDLIKRFAKINEQLKPENQIDALCILDKCYVGKGLYRNDKFELYVDVEKDRNKMKYFKHEVTNASSAFYLFINQILHTIHESVLEVSYIGRDYGKNMTLEKLKK